LRREDLITELDEIDGKRREFEIFKQLLSHSGDLLVDAVEKVLSRGFGFRVDSYDEYREDLKLLNDIGDPIALVEVKGTNSGLRREHVNQADSHRERANFPSGFPTLLLINPLIRSTQSLSDKDTDLPLENIEHAARNGVLVLRTLDLLRLLGYVMSDRCTTQQALTVMTSERGWLRVGEEECHVVKAEDDVQPLAL